MHFDSFSSLLSPRETVADCTLQLMRGNHNQRVQDRKFEIPTSMENFRETDPNESAFVLFTCLGATDGNSFRVLWHFSANGG